MTSLTFAPIPNIILSRTDLSHGAKLCCARLIQYADKDGQAFPKISTLVKELGMSTRAVQRFIAELEALDLVKTQQRGRGQSNIYHVDKSILIHSARNNMPEVACLEAPKVASLDTPKVAYLYKGRKENFKKEIEKITAGIVDNLRMPK